MVVPDNLPLVGDVMLIKTRMVPPPVTVSVIQALTSMDLRKPWPVMPITNGKFGHAEYWMDFDFWNKKLYGSVDAFKEWRSNILVTRTSVPSLLGISVAQDSLEKQKLKVLK